MPLILASLFLKYLIIVLLLEESYFHFISSKIFLMHFKQLSKGYTNMYSAKPVCQMNTNIIYYLYLYIL